MKTEVQQTDNESFQTITLPDEDVSKSTLRKFITVIITVFIGVITIIDHLLEFWLLHIYWVLFALGLVVCSIIIWILLRWNEGYQQKGKDTFLEKWGDEIGWPLMILAFTIQFVIPQIRPLFLGAILGGSWSLIIWNKRKTSFKNHT